MKILFLGNHTVGVEALSVLSECGEIVGVVAHPPDPEDGVRYRSVYEFASECGWSVMRGTGKDAATEDFISSAKPDLIWITDYRYLIPPRLIALARYGAVNLHPSLLPKYRGRAPINWAILHGETRLGLTAHFVDEGVDSGDIIEQVSYELSTEQDVGDALEMLYPLYRELTRTVMEHFRGGSVPRIAQDHRLASVFPRRQPKDGKIVWSESAEAIGNLVRAVAHPYPGAFTSAGGNRLTVWKARPTGEKTTSSKTPGAILEIGPEGIYVQCGSGVLLLISVEEEDAGGAEGLRTGMILGEESL